jgi:hypothetical protein
VLGDHAPPNAGADSSSIEDHAPPASIRPEDEVRVLIFGAQILECENPDDANAKGGPGNAKKIGLTPFQKTK